MKQKHNMIEDWQVTLFRDFFVNNPDAYVLQCVEDGR